MAAGTLPLVKMQKQNTIQHRNTRGAVMMWKPYDTASYTFCPSVPIRLTIWKETEIQISNQSIWLLCTQTHAHLLCWDGVPVGKVYQLPVDKCHACGAQPCCSSGTWFTVACMQVGCNKGKSLNEFVCIEQNKQVTKHFHTVFLKRFPRLNSSYIQVAMPQITKFMT